MPDFDTLFEQTPGQLVESGESYDELVRRAQALEGQGAAAILEFARRDRAQRLRSLQEPRRQRFQRRGQRRPDRPVATGEAPRRRRARDPGKARCPRLNRLPAVGGD